MLGDSEPFAGTPPRIAEAVGALMEVIADDEDQGVGLPACRSLCVIDDLQWIDHASADVLGAVARVLDPSRSRMIMAQRPAIRTYIDTTGHQHHGLTGLTGLTGLRDEAAEALLLARFPDLSTAARSRLVAEAGRNEHQNEELTPKS